MSYDFSAVKLKGKQLNIQPKNLYIPPEALEVYLEVFEGPLDVLLYLIKQQDLDLNNLPLLLIINQYLEYIKTIRDSNLHIASNYLVMSATLMQMKSFCLLPLHQDLDDEEEDPALLLVEQLKEYKKVKQNSQSIDALIRVDRDVFLPIVSFTDDVLLEQNHSIDTTLLANLMAEISLRQTEAPVHEIQLDAISIADKAEFILDSLINVQYVYFIDLIAEKDGVFELLLLFLAMLDLCNAGKINIVTSDSVNDIRLELQ